MLDETLANFAEYEQWAHRAAILTRVPEIVFLLVPSLLEEAENILAYQGYKNDLPEKRRIFEKPTEDHYYPL